MHPIYLSRLGSRCGSRFTHTSTLMVGTGVHTNVACGERHEGPVRVRVDADEMVLRHYSASVAGELLFCLSFAVSSVDGKKRIHRTQRL